MAVMPQLQPARPKGSPIVGFLPQMIGNPLAALQEAARHGEFVELPLLRRKLYFINNPDYIKHVLVDNHKNYLKGRGLQAARPVIGNGLLTSEGAFHMRQRRMIQPTFHRQRVTAYADTMQTYTQHHLDTWQHGEQRDIHAEMMTLTMRIVAKCLFDIDVRDEAHGIGEALEGVFDNFSMLDASPMGMFLSKFPLPRQQRRRRHQKVLDEAIYGFIRQRRNDGSLDERNDLLSMLIESVDVEGDGQGMTDQQLRDEVMTLFLAGHETTANALSWTLYLLSQHPEVEQKLVAELDSILAARIPSMHDLANLKYNKMVFSEAMRLYPPAWVVGRTAIQDDYIDGHLIPAGATVLMSQYVMHRNPLYWDEPEAFRPERFDAETDQQRPRYAYFPFGGGPRVCIGEPFAWMEGELLLAAIVQRYRMSLVPGAVIEPEPLITLRLKHGLPMTIMPR